ncbi:MAG: hypothetical protein IPJ83_17325 [Saprospiraceae bacterium]|nr:hypothetical protein [Candidatus Vicinibacter proximus]
MDSHTELIPGNPPIIKAYPSGCKYIWYFWSMGKAYKIDAYDEYQEIPTFYGDGLYSVDIKCGDKICSEYVNVIKSNTNNTELEDIIVSPNPTTGELYINTRAEITTTEIKLFILMELTY